jgi:hypothetical protein
VRTDRGRAALLLAAAFFALATGWLYGDVLRGRIDDRVVRPESSMSGLARFDQRFAIWLIARNANAILHQPLSLFEAETCHPERAALTLGHPALATGLFAVPAYLASGDPVATYNLVLALLVWSSSLLMFVVVRDLSGSAMAGFVAGAFYGFSELRVGVPQYPFHTNTIGMLLALYLGRRWLQGAGWGAAIGFAAAAALQLSESFYSLLGGALVVAPTLLALAWGEGLSRLGARRVAVVAALLAATIAWLALPYLQRELPGSVESPRVYLTWALVAPGARSFPGLAPLLLAALARIIHETQRLSRFVGVVGHEGGE